MKEVPERITYMQTQVDARINFAEYTEGLAGATVELLRADLERDFVSGAHPELLLAFLKELCEGHFVPMQDLLHDQESSLFDIDLVSEVYTLLFQLEHVRFHAIPTRAPRVAVAVIHMVGRRAVHGTRLLAPHCGRC